VRPAKKNRKRRFLKNPVLGRKSVLQKFKKLKKEKIKAKKKKRGLLVPGGKNEQSESRKWRP